MPVDYRMRQIAIVRSHSGYVVYGVGDLHGVRYHARIPGTPQFWSAGSALAWAQNGSATGRLFDGMTQQGHHAGAERCSSGCDERFVSVWAFNGPALVAVTGALTAAGTPAASPRRRVSPRMVAAPDFSLIPSFPRNAPLGCIAPGILSVGVELECSVPRVNVAALNEFGRRCPRMVIADDGSLNASPGCETAEVTFWSTSLDEMRQWLEAMYNVIVVQTNNSCGFHIHVRPEESLQGAFATRTYWDGFYQAYREMAREPGRRTAYVNRETDHWCPMRPWSQRFAEQALEGVADRYSAINLCSLTRHGFGTIEHRIMPHQLSAEEAAGSVGWMAQTASRLINAPMDGATIDIPTPSVQAGPLELRQRIALTPSISMTNTVAFRSD